MCVRLLDAAHGVRLNDGDGVVKVFGIQKQFVFSLKCLMKQFQLIVGGVKILNFFPLLNIQEN